MLGLTTNHRYYLCRGPTDLRKGFDGLSGQIRQALESDPLDGSVYIFINRRRDRMKLLVWEPSGFVLYYKRLERGTFELPRLEGKSHKIQLKWETLMMLLTGISLKSVRMRKRYQRA